MPVSGADWVRQYPTSKEVSDLSAEFRPKVTKFLDALIAAGANATITATKRPPQRAYLMHYAWCIAHDRVSPANVPPYIPAHSVDIQWLHTNAAGQAEWGASRDAALAMVHGYDIDRLGVAPALRSMHIAGDAIDVVISWKGKLTIKDAKGKSVTIDDAPRDGTNPALIRVGATYGVIHLTNVSKDPPHWSTNGH